MADYYNFYKLTEQITDDKVVTRSERIVTDAIEISSALELEVTTTSNAPYQKVRFFIDAVKFHDNRELRERYLSVGRWCELENGQVATFDGHGLGVEGQVLGDLISYSCSNLGNGTYELSFETFSGYTVYISAVTMLDSFYDYTLNPFSRGVEGTLWDEIEDFARFPNYELSEQTFAGYYILGAPVYVDTFHGAAPSGTTINLGDLPEHFDTIYNVTGTMKNTETGATITYGNTDFTGRFQGGITDGNTLSVHFDSEDYPEDVSEYTILIYHTNISGYVPD